MANFFKKVKNYINQKYIVKYIDNRYWDLVDDHDGKVNTLLKEDHSQKIQKYYPGLDMGGAEKTNLPYYNFIKHRFSRYIYRVSNCLIDPDYNWVILGKKKIFRYSYPMIEDPWSFLITRPSVIAKLFKRKTIQLEKGILVKYLWNNYYHFFIDTLPQIFLFDDFGIPADVPLIVPYNYNQYPYVVRYFTEFPVGRKIIVQEKGQYLKVNELYVAKDVFFSEYTNKIRQDIERKGITRLVTDVETPERLFILRKKGVRRSIANIDEIEQIAKNYGFEVIEPGDYTWEQQVKLFSEAKMVIGAHGAGLTNIIFCKNPGICVLEIFPGKGSTPEHYKNISIQLGYQHISIEGEGIEKDSSATGSKFHLDKGVFEDAIKRLIG